MPWQNWDGGAIVHPAASPAYVDAVGIRLPNDGGIQPAPHPELWYPAVTVGGRVYMWCPDEGYHALADAVRDARSVLQDIAAIARKHGLRVYAPIHQVLAEMGELREDKT